MPKKVINSGLLLALAKDYNLGFAPSGNINLVVSPICIKLKIGPEEAVNGAKINGANAVDLEHKVGLITIGKNVILILIKAINSYATIP
ncbi:hypothetical protein [Gillisia hiemivivida]|uniref:Uncharacterized protein n=1 Tax=Gillisia hiemivivida TaxID=291190 RepID=A0A5C6ZW29_9FLAO|nr:hypothetical protein [Gillisia hiemivivida]TXD95045.1 hypothetical protein ES724_02515 [Gillisia hiemivivida]